MDEQPSQNIGKCATIVVTLTLIVATWAQQPPGESIPIVKYENEGVNADGSYQWSYETGNGIVAQEQGQIKNAESENAAAEVQGSFQYQAPDGTPISLNYVANEEGFQPPGGSFTDSSPIPPAIQKALEWLEAHPEPEQPGQASNLQPVYNRAPPQRKY
ncbi:hypothetical protein NQ317_001109 [Molorchus minor]|uniref:Uncharacterized protein n=1 Tax=Molorchus minor TaxID=1323400 RepID=A0ABQ9IVC1_9CUCU|nr:hypothetical protein NQ317_001109 [Molorchus minor]